MYQRWRYLLFLHWPVDRERLRRVVPPELELDLFAGQAYVSVTPFTMPEVRPAYVPHLPPLTSTHEVNLRTYVRYRGGCPGIWFFSLDASNLLAVLAARAALGLPYRSAEIRMDAAPVGRGAIDRQGHRSPERESAPPVVDYHLRRHAREGAGATLDVHYAPAGPMAPAVLGSRDHFLAERYVLYGRHWGRLYRGFITHDPWLLQAATVELRAQTLLRTIDLPVEGDPVAHYGGGADVEVMSFERLTPSR